MTRLGLSLAVSLILAACSQEVPNPPQSAPVAPSAASQPVARTPAAPIVERIAANDFTLALSDKDCSSQPVAVATVRWDAGSLAPGGVSVFVESPGNARKLWLEAGPKDEAKTGKWVFEGSRFTLQSRETGDVLAQRSVDRIACPAP